MKTFLATLGCLCWAFVSVAVAHVPVPDSVLHPATAPEAWNVLSLAARNLDRLLGEKRLAEMPDQASLCSPALRLLSAGADTPERQRGIRAGSVRTSITLTTLAQAAVAGDADLAKRSLDTLHANLEELAAFFDSQTTHADIFVCPMHPDVLKPDASASCPKCGMRLLTRRIPYSFVYTLPGEPTLRLTAVCEPAMPVAGQKTTVKTHLAHSDGSPVRLSDLEVIHTQPIHLLVIDPALSDYHHEHPAPTETPGDYVFSFTPATSARYRIYADLVPTATGVQEYPCVDLPGESAPASPIDKTNADFARAGGFGFHLEPADGPNSLRSGQARELYISVSTDDGQPMTGLEPVMAAFAHLVGFYDDGHSVVHLHPEGMDANDPALRGGPVLCFRFYPPKSGFLRLYCQVQVDGRAVFAPFGVTVSP